MKRGLDNRAEGAARMTSPHEDNAADYRILAIHRYYWPDTPPYASILRAITRRWTDSGHLVDILSTQPSYKPEVGIPRQPKTELIDGSTVRRIHMPPDRASRIQKLINAIYFPLAVFARVMLGRRYDVVMCSTAPPVLLGVATSLAARMRGSRFIYHCMDIHPEIGAISGEFRQPWIFALLRRLDTGTCRRSTAIVVLSEDMKESLIARDPAVASRVVVLNNFELPGFTSRDSPTRDDLSLGRADGEQIRVVFTGNLGRFQGLETVVEALMTADNRLREIELIFMGDGAAKAELQARVHGDPRFSFLPHGSASQARTLMRSADVGLVSLTPGVIQFAYPSKTSTYLSEGLPLLVAVEADSELARSVTKAEIGFVVPPNDVTAMRACLLEVVSKRSELSDMKARATRIWQSEFEQAALLNRWGDLLDQVGRDGVMA